MPLHVITTASDLAGRALSTVTGRLADVRPADKPLHPVGTTFAGQLLRHGSDEPIGVPWLDQAGEEEVLVRTSRAIGLPGALPDIRGLALRLRKGQKRYADVLFATTGWDPLTRHLLMPALREGQPLTTLLPYRSPIGPIVLGARPTGAHSFELHWAPLGRRWRVFGEITIELELTEKDNVSFDPVLNPLPGLQQYLWVERLRERSYATARLRRLAPHTT